MPTTYAIPNGRTVMDATTFTGDGTNPRSITNQAGFKPDLIWQKSRSGAYAHTLLDSVRGFGNTKALYSNFTDSEGTYAYGYTSAANSNGFSVATGTAGNQYANENGTTYVAWQWQAGQGTTSSNTSGSITSTVSVNATAGFSIVTYTGTGAAGTVGHGLGVAPKFIIVKDRTNTNPWPVYHASLGNQYYILLNATSAADNSLSNYWGSTNPTSTTFGVNGYGGNAANGDNFVAYCWAPVAGFSQFGSYTGNGSADGPFVYLGFRPKFILIKNASGAFDWITEDTSRNSYNLANSKLSANTSSAEYTSNVIGIDFVSNGFKLRATDDAVTQNGSTFIYAAFAENPTKFANAR